MGLRRQQDGRTRCERSALGERGEGLAGGAEWSGGALRGCWARARELGASVLAGWAEALRSGPD